MTTMVQQAVRLGHHLAEWKKAQGILLEKGGKRYFTLVKSYRVMSLLNCMGKLVGKSGGRTVTTILRRIVKLHLGQMGAQTKRCAIDAVASLVHKVE